jgi:hypothetical protein
MNIKENSPMKQAIMPTNSMEYNSISPNAFTNTDNIKGMMGEAVPGTFTRNVRGNQMPQGIDPIAPPNVDAPLMPPARVETPISPPYDINNY